LLDFTANIAWKRSFH